MIWDRQRLHISGFNRNTTVKSAMPLFPEPGVLELNIVTKDAAGRPTLNGLVVHHFTFLRQFARSLVTRWLRVRGRKSNKCFRDGGSDANSTNNQNMGVFTKKNFLPKTNRSVDLVCSGRNSSSRFWLEQSHEEDGAFPDWNTRKSLSRIWRNDR